MRKRSILKNPLPIINIAFLSVAIFFVFVAFRGMSESEFFIIHDQAIWTSTGSIWKNSFVQIFDNGGLANGIQSSLNYINMLPYKAFYFFELPVGLAEKILFVFLIYFACASSFFGFRKIFSIEFENYDNGHESDYDVAIATAFYNFSLFPILNMNTGNYWSISFILAYALLPILFYLCIKFFKHGKLPMSEIIILSLLSFVTLLQFTLLMPILMFFAVFIFLKHTIKKILSISFTQVGLFVFFVLSLFSYGLFMIIYELYFNATNVIGDSMAESTAYLIKGGLASMIAQYFSWALYTPWLPRSIFTFSDFYLNGFYVLSIFALYSIIITCIINSKSIFRKMIPYIGILALALFFAKGPEDPFGGVFEYLVKNFTPFVAIRSPDSKFGIGVVFSLTILIIFSLQYYRTSRKAYVLVRTFFLIITLISSYPLWTGEAIAGHDEQDKSGKFTTRLFSEYKDALDVLNKNKPVSNVLIYPPNPSIFKHGERISVLRDSFRAELLMPVLSYDSKTLTNPKLFDALQKVYDGEIDNTSMEKLNINYVVLRKDILEGTLNSKSMKLFKEKIDKSGMFSRVIENNYLIVYEIKNEYKSSRIHIAEDINYGFENISPVEYNLALEGVKKPVSVIFRESFNKHWKIFAKDNKEKSINYLFLSKKDAFGDVHTVVDDYANGWTIDPEYIKQNFPKDSYKQNPDGSIDVELILYFKPQSYFYLGLIISGTTLAGCLAYLAYDFRKRRKRAKESEKIQKAQSVLD